MLLVAIIAILILSLLVFIHELGHFIMAKRAGVRVEEFGLGIPPRIIGKKYGETLYSLNVFPFGGFVKVSGEDPEDISGTLAEAMKDPRNFMSKSPSVRAGILVAGIVMNFLLAFVLYYGIIAANGFKSSYIPLFIEHTFPFGKMHKINTVVTYLDPSLATKDTTIAYGEAITKINGVPVSSISDVRKAIEDKDNVAVDVTLVDIRKVASEERVVKLTPKFNQEAGRVQLGVVLTPAAYISYDSVFLRLLVGPAHAYNMADYTFKFFGTLFAASVESRDVTPVAAGVSGPVGIAAVINEILKAAPFDAMFRLVDLMAMLSLSLGIMNVLPIPALDGGRLAFVVVEWVSGKKINPSKEAMIHRVGMMVLFALLLLITFKDIKTFL